MSVSCMVRYSLFCLIIQFCGCETVENPQVHHYRQRYFLSEKPEGAISIEQARESIQENENVTLSVWIGARDIPQWWTRDKATMVVSEGLPGSHYNSGDGHDPESCPFCRWKWKVENSAAFVEFRDIHDEIIPLDCKSMLGLEENDHVILKGKGHLNGEGFLEMVVEGVYVSSQ